MLIAMPSRPASILVASLGVMAVAAISLASLRPTTAQWPHLRPADEAVQGLSVRFFGTSTLSFSDGTDTVLIDGYFSRAGLFPLLLKPLEPDQARINWALERGQIRQVSALMVAHSHFDHGLDAIPLAYRFGARLMGGETLHTLTQRHPARLPVEVFTPPQPVQVGAFTITPYLTPHAPGDVAKGANAHAMTHPARAKDWPMGEAYSWLIQHGPCRILVVPSAGQFDTQLKGVRAEVVFLGIGQLATRGEDGTEAYWQATVGQTGARLVIPIHWDDFTRPLSQDLRPLPYVADRLDQSLTRLSRLASRDQVELALPPAFVPLDLRGPKGAGCG